MNCRFVECKDKTQDGKRQVQCSRCGFTIATPTAVELCIRPCDNQKPDDEEKKIGTPPITAV